MRSLSPEESSLRQHRREQFAAFSEERRDVLIDFAHRLQLPDPAAIIEEPKRYLASIAAFMKGQTIREDDRIWILTRLACFIGELLAHEFRGTWFLNEIPDSRYFLQIVVGRFLEVDSPAAMVAPFEIAASFVNEPQGRDLERAVEDVEKELRSLSPR
jgi:hypothetical protein